MSFKEARSCPENAGERSMSLCGYGYSTFVERNESLLVNEASFRLLSEVADLGLLP